MIFVKKAFPWTYESEKAKVTKVKRWQIMVKQL